MKEELKIFSEYRIGTFTISKIMLRTVDLKVLFSQLVIVRAETDLDSDTMKYTAYSKLFEKHGLGMMPPVYIFEFEEYENRIIKCQAKKKEG